jgi:hypothetical protein
MSNNRRRPPLQELSQRDIARFVERAQVHDRIVVRWATDDLRLGSTRSLARVVGKPVGESKLIIDLQQRNNVLTLDLPSPDVMYVELRNLEKRSRSLSHDEDCAADDEAEQRRQVTGSLARSRLLQRESKKTRPQVEVPNECDVSLSEPRRGLLIVSDHGEVPATMELCRESVGPGNICPVCGESLRGCSKITYDSDPETNILRAVVHFTCNEDLGRVEKLQRIIQTRLGSATGHREFLSAFLARTCPWFRSGPRKAGKSMGVPITGSWKKTTPLHIMQRNGKRRIRAGNVAYLWKSTKFQCELCCVRVLCPRPSVVREKIKAPGGKMKKGAKIATGVLDINQGTIHKSRKIVSAELRGILCTQCKDAISALERTSIEDDLVFTKATRCGERSALRAAHAEVCADKYLRLVALASSHA